MPDTSEPRATIPFPSEPAPVAEAAPHDPLAGDWAEGLRGPVREVPIKRPQRLRGQSGPTPRPLAAGAPEQRTEQADLRVLAAMAGAMRGEQQAAPPADDEVEAPDAWASTDDQLASVPPSVREQAEAPLGVASAAEEPAKPPEEAPPAAAAEEVVLLSDAELAEDEPPALAPLAAAEEAAAPVAEAAAHAEAAAAHAEVAAHAEAPAPLAAAAAHAESPAPPAEAAAHAAVPSPLPEAPASLAEAAGPVAELAGPAPAAEAPAAPASQRSLAGPAEPLSLPAAAEHVLLPAEAPLALAAPEAVLALAPSAEVAPAAVQHVAEATHHETTVLAEDAPPQGFRVPGIAVEPEAAPAAAALDPLAAASEVAPADLATDLASDLDAALGPVATAITGESEPLRMPAPDAPVPAEGMRALFTAPTVTGNAGWAAPEAPASVTGETVLNLRPVLHEGPDATVHEGAPIVLPAEQPAAAPAHQGPAADTDLESTLASAAIVAPQQPAAQALPDAPLEAAGPLAPAAPVEVAPVLAAPIEEVVEELPEDAIAEALPEDAIAGTADPAAPWNHAELEVTPPGASAAAPTPWDSAAAPEWRAEAPAGEWAGAAAIGQAATEAWPGASVHAAPADAWGAPPAPAPAAHAAGWGAPPAAAPAGFDAWGAPPAPAAPHDTWGAASSAPAAAHDAWDAASAHGGWSDPAAAATAAAAWSAEHAAPFRGDKLISTPGASDWVVEAVPPHAAPARESAKPLAAASWDARAAPAGEWEPKGGFPIAVPDAPPGSPFAPLAPGATLSAEEPAPGDAAHPDDADLPVPVYEPEPLPGHHLAVVGEHRVAVHTRAGRTRRGIVRDVDLAGTGFALQPQSGTGLPESVQAAEVKAIFFMLPPGEKPAPGTGARVRVTFEDGRTIEGTRDGADAPEGFFLVPGDAARTNTRRIFVARAAVQDLREG